MLELIPSSEKWLYKNKEALESVQKGLRDAAIRKDIQPQPERTLGFLIVRNIPHR